MPRLILMFIFFQQGWRSSSGHHASKPNFTRHHRRPSRNPDKTRINFRVRGRDRSLQVIETQPQPVSVSILPDNNFASSIEHKASFDRSPTPYIPKAHSGKNQGWRSRAFIILSLAPWILQQWQPWLVAHFTCGGTLHLWRHICLIGAIRTLFLNLKSGGYVCRLRVLCVSNLPPIIN